MKLKGMVTPSVTLRNVEGLTPTETTFTIIIVSTFATIIITIMCSHLMVLVIVRDGHPLGDYIIQILDIENLNKNGYSF